MSINEKERNVIVNESENDVYVHEYAIVPQQR